MRDSVKKAAERLRRHLGKPIDNTVYMSGEHNYFDDCATLADAYLSEHLPDDDEAITGDYWKTLNPDEDGDICVGEYFVGVWPDGIVRAQTLTDVMPFPHIQTRGQLRRLIAALTDKRGE